MSTTPPEVVDHESPPHAHTVQDEIEELERRFVGHDENELMMSLKEVVRQHITRPRNDDDQ